LDVEKKLLIVQWHNRCCEDGPDQSWKKDLAEALNAKQSTVSKLVKFGYKFGKIGKSQIALDGLSHEALANVLDIKTTTIQSNHTATEVGIGSIVDENHYAFIAKVSALKLREVGEKAAASYEQSERRLEKRWRVWKACVEEPATIDRNDFAEVPLFSKEEVQIKEVFNSLSSPSSTGRGSSTVVVCAPPHSGITYLLYRLLRQQQKFRHFYSGGIVHVHMDALDQTREIGREVGQVLFGDHTQQIKSVAISKSIGWSRAVAEDLVKNRKLMIVHGATNAVTGSDNTASKFISGVAQAVEELTKNLADEVLRCSRLLVIVWDRNHFQRLGQNGQTFNFNPTIDSGEEAIAYFSDCVEYYRLLRANSNDVPTYIKPGNNTLKRVRLHYSEDAGVEFTPIPASVRFRAFCATDVNASSPFDPTQGVWNRLDDLQRTNLPEITHSLGDVQNFVRGLKPAGRSKEFDAIRLGSTALFYLSSEMLDKLNNLELSNLSSVDLPDVVHDSIGNILQLSSDGSRLTIPLLVRALIQDDWMKFDGGNRSLVHEAIAKNLEVKANDLSQIGEGALELPYSLPWEKHHIVYALESMRHYMRAAQSAEIQKATSLKEMAHHVFNKYLEHGIVTTEPISTGPFRPIGVLSRSFGLDGLKYEALSLLSEDNYAAKAPIGISQKDKNTFFREVGIALTHLLRPIEAIKFFELAEAETETDSVERAYIYSHKITALLESGNLAHANDCLNHCKKIEGLLTHDPAAQKSLSERNGVREAAIHFAQGEMYEVGLGMAKLAGTGLTTYSGERALFYIDAHLPPFPQGIDEIEELGRILMILEQARNDSLRKGFEHERIRLDIRRARLFQLLKIPRVAEPVLERVGIELCSYGGSEMALREFQIASAQTLSLLERPAYAFSAYAWPALNGLHRNNVPVRYEAARQLCIYLLAQFRKDEVFGNQLDNPFRVRIDEISKSSSHPFFSFDLFPSIADLESNFLKFQSEKGRANFMKLLGEDISRFEDTKTQS
jgi:hypothetical protein